MRTLKQAVDFARRDRAKHKAVKVIAAARNPLGSLDITGASDEVIAALQYALEHGLEHDIPYSEQFRQHRRILECAVFTEYNRRGLKFEQFEKKGRCLG